MADLSAITSAIGTASGILVVSPQKTTGYQPQSVSGAATLPSLIFHYEGEQTVSLTNDITDHYVEDNTAVQSNIAIRPIEITTQGFVGELLDFVPANSTLGAAAAAVQTAAQKLTLLASYTPALSVTALTAYNNALFAYQTLSALANSAISTYQSIAGAGGTSVINGTTLTPQPSQNNQQTYFQQFFLYSTNRTLFTVQTPWAIFQNMAIKSLRAVQDAETNQISDFEITFKQMRFATSSTAFSTSAGTLTSDNSEGRNSNQSESLTDYGQANTGPAVGFSSTGPVALS